MPRRCGRDSNPRIPVLQTGALVRLATPPSMEPRRANSSRPPARGQPFADRSSASGSPSTNRRRASRTRRNTARTSSSVPCAVAGSSKPAWRSRTLPGKTGHASRARSSKGNAGRCPPTGAESPVVRSRGDEPADVTPCADKDLRNPPGEGGAECGALSADSGPAAPVSAPPSLPPDVAEIACRLAALPENVRSQIVAMLKADTR